MSYFSGKVSRIIFQKKAQGFYILKLLLDDAKVEPGLIGEHLVVAKGYVPGLNVQVGSWFGFEGKWVEDQNYGRQLAITKAPVFKGVIDPETVASMLCANGVSRMVAYRLKSVFGKDLSVALGDTEQIQKGLGISSFEAEFLTARWKVIRKKMAAMEALNSLDLPRYKVGEIWATFGENTEEILSSNPWALARIQGIPFPSLDELARSAGLDMKSPDRATAAIIYSCREHKGQGDLFLWSGKLLSSIQKSIPGLQQKAIVDAIRKNCEEGSIVMDRETVPGRIALYDPWFHQLESLSATWLAYRQVNAAPDPEDFEAFKLVGGETAEAVEGGEPPERIVEVAIEQCAAEEGWTLSTKQREGLKNALLHPVSILTGLPGTGKSTSMRILVNILRRTGTSFQLVAPTGIAAKRLGSVCGARAYTIHRALGARAGRKDDARESTYAGIVGESKRLRGSGGRGEDWKCNQYSPCGSRYIIVDEFSMVDQHLLYRLLDGSLPTARLVCVGDAAQLPSVGPGNVLREMISCGLLPTTSLTEIFRQEDTSDIVTAAHAIHAGEVPETGQETDFSLLPMVDEKRILKTIVGLSKSLYRISSSFDGKSPPSFQVLSPRHMGIIGVTSLNTHIRKALNPGREGAAEIKMGSEKVREGDRVMVVKNNYDLGVYNGDVGKIVQLSRKNKRVVVKIHGAVSTEVIFTLSEAFDHLRLAYACTVHKYQGLEVDVVVMPLVMGFRHQLQRNLLYTAITRARKKVVLVGSHKALQRAIENDKEDARNSLFGRRVRAAFESLQSKLQEGADWVSMGEDVGLSHFAKTRGEFGEGIPSPDKELEDFFEEL